MLVCLDLAEIVRLGQVEDESQVDRMTHLEEVHLQMSVRANNMVNASESLLKLVSDVKQYLILNDFPSCNESISHNTQVGTYVTLICFTPTYYILMSTESIIIDLFSRSAKPKIKKLIKC